MRPHCAENVAIRRRDRRTLRGNWVQGGTVKFYNGGVVQAVMSFLSV